MKRLVVILVAVAALLGSACGDDGPTTIFPEKLPCSEAPLLPLQGQHQMVMSFLEIGSADDGFDLDGDGEPDNKLSGVGSIARGAIEDSFEDFSIIIPIEFFDYPTTGADECVKFAMYLGQYSFDNDGDGDNTADRKGDCNDHDADIHRGVAEIPDNFKDDDCDGLADEVDEVISSDAGEMMVTTLSDNTDDNDGDGVTIADGDCDDTEPLVLGPGTPEICGDGLDNDCDGRADYALDEIGAPVCTPYDDSSNPDDVLLDPLSFEANGDPVIKFEAARVTADNQLFAGPALFSVGIPVTDDLNLDLRITGATIEADIMMMEAGIGLTNGRLGGVLDAQTADRITGLEIEGILTEEDTLLDAVFANLLGTIIGLPKVEIEIDGVVLICQTPDIDVDLDGLEAFCDSDPVDEVNNVDICVDGNGDIFRDVGDVNCTEVKNDDGTFKFLDGISVEINFETVPVVLPSIIE